MPLRLNMGICPTTLLALCDCLIRCSLCEAEYVICALESKLAKTEAINLLGHFADMRL
jgi:hypothetical protein